MNQILCRHGAVCNGADSPVDSTFFVGGKDSGNGFRRDIAGNRVTGENHGIAQVQVAKGTVASLTVDENAPGATVTINRGAEVKELNLDITLGGVILQIRAGTHDGFSDFGNAVGADGDVVILQVINQQLVGHHVAQHKPALWVPPSRSRATTPWAAYTAM